MQLCAQFQPNISCCSIDQHLEQLDVTARLQYGSCRNAFADVSICNQASDCMTQKPPVVQATS